MSTELDRQPPLWQHRQNLCRWGLMLGLPAACMQGGSAKKTVKGKSEKGGTLKKFFGK